MKLLLLLIFVNLTFSQLLPVKNIEACKNCKTFYNGITENFEKQNILYQPLFEVICPFLPETINNQCQSINNNKLQKSIYTVIEENSAEIVCNTLLPCGNGPSFELQKLSEDVLSLVSQSLKDLFRAYFPGTDFCETCNILKNNIFNFIFDLRNDPERQSKRFCSLFVENVQKNCTSLFEAVLKNNAFILDTISEQDFCVNLFSC